MCKQRDPGKIRVVVVTANNQNIKKFNPALRAALGEDWDDRTIFYQGLRHLGGLICPSQEPEPFPSLKLLVIDGNVDGPDYSVDHFLDATPQIGHRSRPIVVFVNFPDGRVADLCSRHGRMAIPISNLALYRLAEFLDQPDQPAEHAAAA